MTSSKDQYTEHTKTRHTHPRAKNSLYPTPRHTLAVSNNSPHTQQHDTTRHENTSTSQPIHSFIRRAPQFYTPRHSSTPRHARPRAVSVGRNIIQIHIQSGGGGGSAKRFSRARNAYPQAEHIHKPREAHLSLSLSLAKTHTKTEWWGAHTTNLLDAKNAKAKQRLRQRGGNDADKQVVVQ